MSKSSALVSLQTLISKILKNETKSRTHILSLKISLNAFNFIKPPLSLIIKPQFFQPLLDTPTSLKLKSLKLHGPPTDFELLIKKVGSYLEHLELFIIGASGGVYESVIINCDQIKFLCLANLYHDDNSQLYGMITRSVLKSLSSFLVDYKHDGLNKFLFRNRKNEGIDITFNILKNFFVKEMPSFVKMQRYHDLVVRISDINYD
ncbi:15654_t:CDS:2 [Funneliformis mosseae]|uniref:15654_t:CDS:1 n=1 Tax=Funneliformis mosseae TaxID=27381 RepID=A0A9N9GHU6_FUNMO|nr:15654_t:CDS:2 [Funneliformis mosseae]